MANLWLFDIDGTLVNINKIHMDTYRKIYLNNGINVSDELVISTFGMTENEIHKNMFHKMNMSYDKRLIEKIQDQHQKAVVESIKNLKSIAPLEGVTDCLNYLRKNDEYIGVVTGNIKKSAELILKKSKLDKYFSFLGCDSGNQSRKQIVLDAVEKARKLKYDFKKIIVIGDTIHDIEAGKIAGAITVGVATGSGVFAELKKAKADIVLRTLKNYRKIINKINIL